MNAHQMAPVALEMLGWKTCGEVKERRSRIDKTQHDTHA